MMEQLQKPTPEKISLLQTKRIRLRAVEPSDIDFLYHLENDPVVWKAGNTITPFSKYQIEQYVYSTEHDIYSERQLRLMIDVKNGNDYKCAGAVDLFDFDPNHRRAGVGILIIPEERENGYASEAIMLIKDYAKEVLQLHQLYCSVMTGNEASMSLFESAGFRSYGMRKEWRYQNDSWIDELLYQYLF